MISDPSWMNSDPTLHCQVEPEPADLHAIVCVHCPFTLFYPVNSNRPSFQHQSPCLVLLSLHNKWLPMDCVPLRQYVLRHRGLLQSSVLQMRSVLLDALLGRSTSLSNVNHRAIHASKRVHDPGLLRSRQFIFLQLVVIYFWYSCASVKCVIAIMVWVCVFQRSCFVPI